MYEALWQALGDNPQDTLTRSALADWYEERGEQEWANYFRWTNKKKYFPAKLREDLKEDLGGDYQYGLLTRSSSGRKNYPLSILPDDLYNMLPTGGGPQTFSCVYKTIQEVENDLFNAYLLTSSPMPSQSII